MRNREEELTTKDTKGEGEKVIVPKFLNSVQICRKFKNKTAESAENAEGRKEVKLKSLLCALCVLCG
jgi:hypothetical protein